MLKPYPWQEDDIRAFTRAAEKGEGIVLNGSGMGTGKTLFGVECARRTGAGRVLIVAPLNTFDGWKRTITAQVPDAEVWVFPPGGNRAPGAEQWWQQVMDHKPGWYLIGWEALRGMPDKDERARRRAQKELHKALGMAAPSTAINKHWGFSGTWDLVIADEVHRAANHKSTTAKTLKTVPSRMRIAMSGTPAGNKVEGFFSVLQWLWPERYPHFWPWVMEHCHTELDEYAGRRVLGEKKQGTITASIPLYLRRTAEEVMKDLPKRIVRRVEVPLKGGVQRRVYDDLEKQAFAWLEDKPLNTPVPIVQSLRMRQVALGVPVITEEERPVHGYLHRESGRVLSAEEAAQFRRSHADVKLERVQTGTEMVDVVSFDKDAKSNKIDAMMDILTDIPEDEPVLILTHSAKFAVPVVHQLNMRNIGPAVAWTGDTSSKGRKAIMRDFGRPGGPRFIVAGIAAIGEGVDGLQHVCAHEIWLSQHDNNLLNAQAAARLTRGGQKRPVQAWYIESKGTVDTRVYVRLAGNARQMRAAYRKENPR